MKKSIYFLLFCITALGVIITYYSFPVIYPDLSIKYELSREQIKDIARKELSKSNFDYTNYSFLAYFDVNSTLLTYLNKKFDSDSMRSVFNKYKITNYSVQVLSKDDVHNVSINSRREINTLISSKVSFLFTINSSGEILKYEKKYPDDYKTEFTDSVSAFLLCYNFLKERYPDYNFKIFDSKVISTIHKNSIIFYAKGNDKNGNELRAQIEIANKEITNLIISYAFESNEDYKKPEDKGNGYEILSFISTLLLMLILVILMIKRIKNDEINFRFGIILGCIVGLLFTLAAVFSIVNQGEVPGFFLIIPIIFIFLFISIIFIIILSGTDSVARYYWNEKFYSFDAVRKGYIFVSKVKDSILSGFLMAGILLLISTVFNFSIQNIFGINRGIYFPPDQNANLNLLGNDLSIFYVLLPIITNAIIYAFGGPLYITSLLKMRIKSNYVIIILSSLIIATLDLPVGIKPKDFYAHLGYGVVIGLALTLIFLKYDLLTVIFSLFFEQLLLNIIKFNYFIIDGSSGNQLILILLLVFFAIIWIAAKLRNKDINYEELTPAIVKRITERERISKEIEAARHIQQSFLPDKLPNIRSLDVGSVCLPALEVGGDYYDYFKLDDNRLAIVIGDVSGKGIKAAFYMTLVKGIIKAQSQMYNSPAEILSKANKIFYELVEKGNFISLIYGIFDVEKRILTYANAGHNHIIVKEISNGALRYDKTEGMALGLSDDLLFMKNIKEQIISFRPGDIFVFYTDGVVEAMNKAKEEYGSDRFIDLINELSGNNSKDMVSLILNRIKKFIGKAEQHDDLTLVIIKIK